MKQIEDIHINIIHTHTSNRGHTQTEYIHTTTSTDYTEENRRVGSARPS